MSTKYQHPILRTQQGGGQSAKLTNASMLKCTNEGTPFFRGKMFSVKLLYNHSPKKQISKVKNKNQQSSSSFGKKQKWLLVASGAVMGLLNGFFGGGGGMVCVPILEKVLHLDSKHAHATAIAVILPLSLISAFIYVLNGYIQSFPLVTVGVGVIAGGVLGSFALKWLPPKVIRIIFAVIMFLGGIKLIF